MRKLDPASEQIQRSNMCFRDASWPSGLSLKNPGSVRSENPSGAPTVPVEQKEGHTENASDEAQQPGPRATFPATDGSRERPRPVRGVCHTPARIPLLRERPDVPWGPGTRRGAALSEGLNVVVGAQASGKNKEKTAWTLKRGKKNPTKLTLFGTTRSSP